MLHKQATKGKENAQTAENPLNSGVGAMISTDRHRCVYY
jgi:hypothetical protein